MPTPPENSGLTVEIIDDVLRTVCLARDADLPGEAGKPDEAVITGQGYFRLGELKSSWTEYKSALSALARVAKDLAEARENVEHEESELAGLQERLRTVQYKIEVFQQLLDELGIADIDRRLRELEQRQKELEKLIKQLDGQITQIKIDLAVAQKEAEEAARQLEQAESALEQQTARWLAEWDRRLVMDWVEVIFDPADSPAVFRAAGQVDQRYRERYAGKTYTELSDQLHDVFHNTRQALHDYAPETVTEDETHRLLVLFTRDRHNPVPPHLLVQELKELEEEQKHLLNQKDRELYEQIILHSVGKAIRDKIYRAEKWVQQMNGLMQQRETSSGLRLHLKWEPRTAANERELKTCIEAMDRLVQYPDRRQRLPVFAAGLTGDPHALDGDRPLGRLLFFGLHHIYQYTSFPKLNTGRKGERFFSAGPDWRRMMYLPTLS